MNITVAEQNGGRAEWVELFITLTKGMGEPNHACFGSPSTIIYTVNREIFVI